LKICDPLFTKTYKNANEFSPNPGSIYILGDSPEQRSAHYKYWMSTVSDVEFINIIKQDTSYFDAQTKDSEEHINLRSIDQLKNFLEKFNRDSIYLDITGLAHHIWAPLLKASLSMFKHLMAVYVEPASYRFSSTPKEGEIFDLSERISGISPIPGFISLKDPPDEEKVCFVPLLGFEGARLAYLIEQVQPPGEKIWPIIGVPGFRPEYPFFSYHGNQLPLLRTHAWKNVRYAIANCPFSLFYTLEIIASEIPDNFIKIAPIGTKPHALGAILYSLENPDSVELVYDHPIRKKERTEGIDRLLVYNISSFIARSQEQL